MRRFIDIVVALTALLVLSPVLVLIALAVVADSRGSAHYCGRRIGKDGVPFRMWKFRTMSAGSDTLGSITGRNDPRITRVGRILRKTKLDELPQFLNVLFGDMTLVGPRPEAPDIVALYSPAERAVLAVKPGITGRVQLDAGDEPDLLPEGTRAHDYYAAHFAPVKVRRDLDYLRERSAMTDAQIVFDTAAYVLRACFRR